MLEQRLFRNIFNLTKPPIKVQIGKDSREQLVSTHSSKILVRIVETSAPRVRGPSTNSHEGQKRNCKAEKQKQDSILSRERSEDNHKQNYHSRRVYDLSATGLSVFFISYLFLSISQQLYEHPVYRRGNWLLDMAGWLNSEDFSLKHSSAFKAQLCYLQWRGWT